MQICLTMLLDEGDVASNERFIGVAIANGDVDCNDDGTNDDAIVVVVVFLLLMMMSFSMNVAYEKKK